MSRAVIRYGGRAIVGLGAPTPQAELDAYAAAQVAAAALRADPLYCVTVAQQGSATNLAVLNFKRAWSGQASARALSDGPTLDATTVAAIQQLAGGAPIPACTPPAVVSRVSNEGVAALAIGVSCLTAGGLGYLVGLAAKRPRTGAALGAVLGGVFTSVGVVGIMRAKP